MQVAVTDRAAHWPVERAEDEGMADKKKSGGAKKAASRVTAKDREATKKRIGLELDVKELTRKVAELEEQLAWHKRELAKRGR